MWSFLTQFNPGRQHSPQLHILCLTHAEMPQNLFILLSRDLNRYLLARRLIQWWQDARYKPCISIFLSVDSCSTWCWRPGSAMSTSNCCWTAPLCTSREVPASYLANPHLHPQWVRLINCIFLAFDICFMSEFPKPTQWINPSIMRCIEEVSKAELVRLFGTSLTEQLASRHWPKSTWINLSMPAISTFMRSRVMGRWTDLLFLKMTCGYWFHPRFLVSLCGSGFQRKYEGRFRLSIQQLLPSVIWTSMLQMGHQLGWWIPWLVP